MYPMSTDANLRDFSFLYAPQNGEEKYRKDVEQLPEHGIGIDILRHRAEEVEDHLFRVNTR